MTSILILEYYYRNRIQRKELKALFEQNPPDIENAKLQLDSIVTEHDNYITSRNIPNDRSNFTSIDNKALHHAQVHAETSDKSEAQRLATIDALDEELNNTTTPVIV